jgi:hypothetical protein
MGSLLKEVKVVKLDGRHSHKGLFDYMLQFNAWSGLEKYQRTLQYCHAQWGPTVDVETYSALRWDSVKRNYQFEFGPHWSYLARYGDYRIYLTEDATSWIKLAEPWKS